jgi:hypothetical protein
MRTSRDEYDSSVQRRNVSIRVEIHESLNRWHTDRMDNVIAKGRRWALGVVFTLCTIVWMRIYERMPEMREDSMSALYLSHSALTDEKTGNLESIISLNANRRNVQKRSALFIPTVQFQPHWVGTRPRWDIAIVRSGTLTRNSIDIREVRM